MLDELPAIDLKESLKLLEGDVDLAEAMVTLFVKQIPKYRERIHEMLRNINSQRKQIAYFIHKLQGGTHYVGVPQLQQLLMQMNKRIIKEKILHEDELEFYLRHILKAFETIEAAYNSTPPP